jgi:VanZ family protein
MAHIATRKAGHVAEYSILAFLVWNALAAPFGRRFEAWPRREARLAFLVTVLYASTDEFHQAFVPSRGSSVHDVGFDACGALLSLGVVWLVGRLRKAW